MHRTRLYLVLSSLLGLAYGNIGKPPFWASNAYHGITMKNSKKELTAKATSEFVNALEEKK